MTIVNRCTQACRGLISEFEPNDKTSALSIHQLWVVLMLACVCMLGLNYLKYFSVLDNSIQLFAGWLNESPRRWLGEFQRWPYANLLQNLWWGLWHWVFFFILPWLLIRYGFKRRLSDFGWSWGETHKHTLGYSLLLMPVMVFAILASFRPDFVNHYPFYSDAKFSLLDLLVWEIIYISQFVTVEFFFRGFLLSSLQPRFGSLAIAVMCVPYLMLHFTKPWLEAAGAIGFGFFLGILALKSRSIWGGVIVHAGIALCMDCAALIQAENFPINFLR